MITSRARSKPDQPFHLINAANSRSLHRTLWRGAFALPRSWRHDHAAMLCAFDLIEVDGKDLRSSPIEQRNIFAGRHAAPGT